MAADIYTKAFKDLAEFNHVRWLINHMDPKDFDAVINKDFRSVEVSSDVAATNVLVDNNDNAYCIECNPRLHSAIVSFESQTKVIVECKVNIEIILELLTILNNLVRYSEKNM